jgi:serine/threonine protein kinase
MLTSMVTAGPPQGTSERGTASSQYDLLARLAAGGMAEIFLARANSLAGLERYVVLKRIRPERGDDARWVAMFLDEARLAAQLQHPNIAQVFDLGQIGDDYFYTMEYVHGEDLLDILGRTSELKQPMPVQVALSIIAGAAAGVAHAHERCAPDGRPLGIVHRDLSPSNLMVSMEGTVKVVDFGVAKARFRSTETQAGTIMGKVAYLSPEQCTTGEIDHRSDIFSLGIVMYEMLTNSRLFKRETDYETLRSIARDNPIAPSAIVPNLPRGLDEVVLRALAKDPDKRYHTAHAMLDALEHVAEKAGMSITSNVLRRYMRDLFGMREEPWRELERAMIPMIEDSEIELIEDDSRPRVVHGLPADAKADAVPMLQQTGMIDLEALFGTQMISRPRLDVKPDTLRAREHPIAIPTGSIVMVPLPVPKNARVATNTSIVRVATGSADGIPYPVRRSVNTAAVRRPRSLQTVLITAGVLVGVAVIVYALFVHHPKPTPASVSGSAAGNPTVTHIDEAAKLAAPVPMQPAPAKPVQIVAPAAKLVAPPTPVPVPANAKPSDAPKPVTVKPIPKKTAPAAVDKKPESPKKDTSKCSDPLDCQY